MKIKRDNFRRSRGGTSKVLKIYCEHCNNYILLYQKDGPGILKRLYLDRIFEPESLTNLHKVNIKEVPKLVCNECKRLLGVPEIYDIESRPSYRLFVGAVIKKLYKK